MEDPKKVYQPGAGSEVEVVPAPSDPAPTPPAEPVEEEGSGDYVEEKDDPEKADEDYAKHRRDKRKEVRSDN